MGSFLFFSSTAAEPNIGTVGALEIDLLTITEALAARRHQVTIVAGTIPGEVQDVTSTTHRGVRIVRFKRFSPTNRPWHPAVDVSPDELHKDQEIFERLRDEVDASVMIGVNPAEIDFTTAKAFVAAAQGRAIPVHIPVTPYNDIRTYGLPWQHHLFPSRTESSRALKAGAKGRNFRDSPAVNSAAFNSNRPRALIDDTLERVFQRGVPDNWIYIPGFTDIGNGHLDKARAIIASHRATNNKKVFTIVTHRTTRFATPDLSANRNAQVADLLFANNFDFLEIPVLDHESMALLEKGAPLTVTTAGTRTALEVAMVEGNLALSRPLPNAHGSKSPHGQFLLELHDFFRGPTKERALEQRRMRRVARVQGEYAADRIADHIGFYEQLDLRQKPERLRSRVGPTTMHALQHSTISRQLGVKLPDAQFPAVDTKAKLHGILLATMGPESLTEVSIAAGKATGAEVIVTMPNFALASLMTAALHAQNASDVVVIDASSIRNTRYYKLGQALREHAFCRGFDSDINDRRNIGRLLFPDSNVLFLDDDVSFRESPEFLNDIVKYLGTRPKSFAAIGMPVEDKSSPNTPLILNLEEADLATDHHAAKVFGFRDGSLIGGGCLIAHTDQLLHFASVYGEDWLALMDAFGSGKIGFFGSARQLPGWPLSNIARVDKEAHGNFLTNALIDWMVDQRVAGKLQRRSWTQITPEFLDRKLQENTAALRRQLTIMNGKGGHRSPFLDSEQQTAVSVIERQITRMRDFDVEEALDFLRLYAATADELEQERQRVPKNGTLIERARALGFSAFSTNESPKIVNNHGPQRIPRSKPNAFRPDASFSKKLSSTEPILSDRWLNRSLSGSGLVLSSLLADVIKDIGSPFAITPDLSPVQELLGDIDVMQGLTKTKIDPLHIPKNAMFRWLNISPHMADLVLSFAGRHILECEKTIENLLLNPKISARLTHALQASVVTTFCQTKARERLDCARRDAHTPITNPPEFLRRLLFNWNEGQELPPLFEMILRAEASLENVRQLLTPRNPLPGSPLRSLRNQAFATMLFRMATVPTPSDPLAISWQRTHREDFLQALITGDWDDAFVVIKTDTSENRLPEPLAQIWGDNWLNYRSPEGKERPPGGTMELDH